jgi:hypothetical protein
VRQLMKVGRLSTNNIIMKIRLGEGTVVRPSARNLKVDVRGGYWEMKVIHRGINYMLF